MSRLDSGSLEETFDDRKIKKKKKRSLGHFQCPDCDKTFSRTDHLARHYLNHNPKQVFECDFMLETLGGGRRRCGKTFVRKDLKERHMRRHLTTGQSSRINWSSIKGRPSPDEYKSSGNGNGENYTSTGESPLQISNLVHNLDTNPPEFSKPISNLTVNVERALPNQQSSSIIPVENGITSPDYNKVHDHKLYNGMQTQNELMSWLFNDSSPPNALSPMNEVLKGVDIHKSPLRTDLTAYENIRSYELADSNVFQNDINPLEEILLRNSLVSVFGANDSIDGASLIGAPGFDFSLPSTVSLTSPTSTNDSNATPALLHDDLSPSDSPATQRKLYEYGAKYNIMGNTQSYIDKSVLHDLFTSLPALKRDFVELIFNDKVLIEDRFSYYLSVYWSVFHPQFNILHRPSFSTKSSEPLLLLSMILIGCNYCTPADDPVRLGEPRSKSPEYKLALGIATPLRYQIFQHDGFKSPVKLWVLQSLNLLEWSEKNFLSRTMHERAHIHHGTTVQLMRRSPALGGNPAHLNKTGNDEDYNSKDLNSTDLELFRKWVDSESMKRITFMTFYVDIADYVKFRHNPVIEFHQLQLLKLPCDDEIWEASDTNKSFYKVMKKQKKLKSLVDPNETFISILKKLMKGQKMAIKVPIFVKKILFGGLLSIMYQMQQIELQDSSSLATLPHNLRGYNSAFQAWKDSISMAIDNFSLSIGQTCKTVDLNKYYHKLNDDGVSTCKFSVYHLAHIVGLTDMNTYDISIYCGSPANQNVSISLNDRLVVERKLLNMWLKDHNALSRSDIINFKGIIHCYIFLWESLLDNRKDDSQSGWEPSKDYFDGMFAMSLVMQTLWSYCFLTSGSESQRYLEIQNDIDKLDKHRLQELSVETAYEYLFRIRHEFLTHLRRENNHNDYSIENLYDLNNSDTIPHNLIVKYCSILSRISNKQNISGLCFLVGSKLYNSQWELVRENGRLIINCGFRSIGKKEVFCSDVFDVELLD